MNNNNEYYTQNEEAASNGLAMQDIVDTDIERGADRGSADMIAVGDSLGLGQTCAALGINENGASDSSVLIRQPRNIATV